MVIRSNWENSNSTMSRMRWGKNQKLSSRKATTPRMMALQLQVNRARQRRQSKERLRTFRSLQPRSKQMLRKEHPLSRSIARRLSGSSQGLLCQANQWQLSFQTSSNATTATWPSQSQFHSVAISRRRTLGRARDSEIRWRSTREDNQIAKTWSRLKTGSWNIQDLTQRSTASSSPASRKISCLERNQDCPATLASRHLNLNERKTSERTSNVVK